MIAQGRLSDRRETMLLAVTAPVSRLQGRLRWIDRQDQVSIAIEQLARMEQDAPATTEITTAVEWAQVVIVGEALEEAVDSGVAVADAEESKGLFSKRR